MRSLPLLALAAALAACARPVRGALEPLDGVTAVAVEPGRKVFAVDYDPERVSLETLLAELESAGEPARPAP